MLKSTGAVAGLGLVTFSFATAEAAQTEALAAAHAPGGSKELVENFITEAGERPSEAAEGPVEAALSKTDQLVEALQGRFLEGAMTPNEFKAFIQKQSVDIGLSNPGNPDPEQQANLRWRAINSTGASYRWGENGVYMVGRGTALSDPVSRDITSFKGIRKKAQENLSGSLGDEKMTVSTFRAKVREYVASNFSDKSAEKQAHLTTFLVHELNSDFNLSGHYNDDIDGMFIDPAPQE